MQLGIDLGGTKTEVIVLNNSKEVFRHRVPSARDSYEGSIQTIRDLVFYAEEQVGEQCSIGMGMPGIISPLSGLAKNANSTWLNGKPFDTDLSKAIGRKVRTTNDANCLAVSEAADGAGKDGNIVFAFILGTGSGSGIVVNGKVIDGHMGNGGEYGHIPLAWQDQYEFDNAPQCYCGHKGCYELWVSGTGFERDYAHLSGQKIKGTEITALSQKGDETALKAIEGYKSRLGRAIAMITNILDPDVFVLGGGMSNAPFIDDTISDYVRPYVFGGEFQTPVRKAVHGDSSGVRGAAWLWTPAELNEALKSY
ncbi:MAG: ROK family protein [Alphaproteobacteria bacterium]